MFRLITNAVSTTSRRALVRQTQRKIGTKVVIDDEGKSIRVVSQNNTYLEENALQDVKETLGKNGIDSGYTRSGGVNVEYSPFSTEETIRRVESAQKEAERTITQVVVTSQSGNNATHVQFSALDVDALNHTKQALQKRGFFSRIENTPNPTLITSSTDKDFVNTIIDMYYKKTF